MCNVLQIGCRAVLLLGLVVSARAGVVVGTVSAARGADLSEFVVSIEDLPAAPAAVSRLAVMDQKGLRFIPHLLPIVVGTTVEFRNSDPLSHNVFSISEPKRFNLGLYEAGTARRITFDRTGVVQVLCNVHLEMSAIVLVLPNGYFARAATDGTYRIAGVPAGRHRVRCWHEKLGAIEREVVVSDSGEATENFRAQ